MGRLVLFIVLAASVGGSVVGLATRGTVSATGAVQAEVQADALAREIAESGLALALTRMTAGGGLADPDLKEIELRDGEFSVDFTALGSDLASVRVRATYEGAVHEIQNTYRYDPMDLPGPLWLDVPYGTGSQTGRLKIDGGPDRLPVRLDPRRHADHDLESFLPMDRFEGVLGYAVQRAGGRFETTPAAAWAGPTGLLEDLDRDDHIEDTEALYRNAIDAFDAADGDVWVSGPTGRDGEATGPFVATGSRTWGGAANVTVAKGGLTVAGTVTGSGVLVVDGDLKVEPKGSLTWRGLVIVRGTKDVLALDLNGTVDVDGAMAVVHDGFAPGGHMDVSVYQDKDGMTQPHGNLVGANRQWGWRPWFEHTHKFDQTPGNAPRGRHVYYLENGRAGRHEAEVEFAGLLSRLGRDTEVYLEFANAENHGFTKFALELAGRPGTVRGTVRSGFPSDFRAVLGGGRRSATFRAGDLRSLDLDVQSLRSLRPMFNTGSSPCSDWPVCIGQDWDRRESLALRLVRASDGKRLYESTLYWHMKGDEIAAHEAAEAKWRQEIRDGRTFGTRLNVGGDVTLTYDRRPIAALTEKMGFDGDRVELVTAAAAHTKPSEAAGCVAGAVGGRALTGSGQLSPGTAGRGGPCAADKPSQRPVEVCYNGTTARLPAAEVAALGDLVTAGPCPTETPDTVETPKPKKPAKPKKPKKGDDDDDGGDDDDDDDDGGDDDD